MLVTQAFRRLLSLAADLAAERDLLRAVVEYTDVHLAYLDTAFRFTLMMTENGRHGGTTGQSP